MEISSRLEDYLETLFHLEISGQRQTVSAMAKDLNLTKGTVVAGVKRIVEAGLAEHSAYGDISLTPEGRRIGWKVYAKHRRLRAFFYDFLGADLEKADEIACLIEHHINGKVDERFFNLLDFLYAAKEENEGWMKELLGSLDAEREHPKPLTLYSKSKGKVCFFSGSGEMQKNVSQKGLHVGVTLEALSFEPETKEYVMRVSGQKVVLPFSEAATVWLKSL